MVHGGRDAEHVLSDAYVLEILFVMATSAVGGECECECEGVGVSRRGTSMSKERELGLKE